MNAPDKLALAHAARKVHQRTPAQIAAEIAAQLMWGAKTENEIREAVFSHSNDVAKVRKYVDAFHESGCAYIESFTKRGAKRWAWNGKPFERGDATKDQTR